MIIMYSFRDAPTYDSNNYKVVTNSLPIVPKGPSFGKFVFTFFVKKTYDYGLFVEELVIAM